MWRNHFLENFGIKADYSEHLPKSSDVFVSLRTSSEIFGYGHNMVEILDLQEKKSDAYWSEKVGRYTFQHFSLRCIIMARAVKKLCVYCGLHRSTSCIPALYPALYPALCNSRPIFRALFYAQCTGLIKFPRCQTAAQFTLIYHFGPVTFSQSRLTNLLLCRKSEGEEIFFGISV